MKTNFIFPPKVSSRNPALGYPAALEADNAGSSEEIEVLYLLGLPVPAVDCHWSPHLNYLHRSRRGKRWLFLAAAGCQDSGVSLSQSEIFMAMALCSFSELASAARFATALRASMYGVFAFGRTGIPAEAISSVKQYNLVNLPMCGDAQFVSDNMLSVRQLTQNRLPAQEEMVMGPGPRVSTSGGQSTCTFISVLLALAVSSSSSLALAALELAIAGIRVVHVAQPGWSVFWG